MKTVLERFPGIRDGWARFDGPAGTQMVDVAIAAMSEWASGGDNANGGGYFEQSQRCDALMERARATIGELLSASPEGVCFGPNMTTMTLAFTRAVGTTLGPGDRVIGTRLDHDANVTPWRLACDAAGAEHVLAPFDAASGRLDTEALVALIDDRTRWVAVTAASNLLGTIPDLDPVVAAARSVGARVFVDAVHRVPHRRIDVGALGCDALVTSPYKWYGPHAGVLWCEPQLLEELPVAKVRPAPSSGPARFETGTPSYEAIAATECAARFLVTEDLDRVETEEQEVFAPLLDGLLETAGIRVWGPHSLDDRTPTVAFTVDNMHPDEVARALAAEKIATWSGHSYAVEAVEALGLTDHGGIVRAGVVRYVTPDDVERLLTAVRRLAASF